MNIYFNIGDLINITDNMGAVRTGIVLSKGKFNYERWGGGGRWIMATVMTDGIIEEWRIGGTTGNPYRKSPKFPRRWAPAGVQVVSQSAPGPRN